MGIAFPPTYYLKSPTEFQGCNPVAQEHSVRSTSLFCAQPWPSPCLSSPATDCTADVCTFCTAFFPFVAPLTLGVWTSPPSPPHAIFSSEPARAPKPQLFVAFLFPKSPLRGSLLLSDMFSDRMWAEIRAKSLQPVQIGPFASRQPLVPQSTGTIYFPIAQVWPAF